MQRRRKPGSQIRLGIDKRLLESIRGPYDQTNESDHDIILNGTAAFVDRVLYAAYQPPIQQHWMTLPTNDKILQTLILTIPPDIDKRLNECAGVLKISRVYVVRSAIYDLSRSADMHFKGEQRP